MKLFHLAAIAAIAVTASSAFAADTLIDGYETNKMNGYSPYWSSVDDPGSQSTNCKSPAASLNTDLNFVTEGVGSQKFTWTWALGSDAGTRAANAWGESELKYWAVRCDQAGAISISKSFTGIKMDVYNDSNLTLHGSILLKCSGASYTSKEDRTVLPAKTWTTVTWDLANDNVITGVLIGAGTKTGAPLPTNETWDLRGFCIYEPTEPTEEAVTLYFDNFCGYSGQDDNDPPAPPVMSKIEQGSAPGKLKVSWYANDSSDGVDKYSVMVLPASAYKDNNRLSYANPDVTEFAATATSGEVDVTAGEPCYVYMTATDAATPKPNESASLWPLAACLNPSGAETKVMYIPDLRRWTKADSQSITYQYEVNETTYYAPALTSNTLYFSCATPKAIQDGVQSLVKEDDGFVIWCNGLDGLSSLTPMEDASCEKLTDYINAGGKLIISGSQWLPALTAEGASEAAKALVAALKTSYNAEATGTIIDFEGFDGFSNAGVCYTGTDTWNLAAGYQSAHSALLADSPAIAVGNIKDASDTIIGNAMVVNNNQTIALGFGFEQVRHIQGEGTSADIPDAQQKRTDLMAAFKDYLVAGSGVADWSLF